MTKLEFMKELESLLLDIPLEEREAALQYYNGYFDDAGEDHENEIITELGSPTRVAKIIKADLNINATDRESRGYFTENGYQDTIENDDKFALVGAEKKITDQTKDTNSNPGGAKQGAGYQHTDQGQYQGTGSYNQTYTNQTYANQTSANKKSTNVGLIILICILAAPIGLPIIFSAISVIFSLVISAFAIIFAIGVAGIACICAGVALFVAGLLQIGVPMVGILMIGAGLLLFGIGMLITLLFGFICKTAIPAMINGIVNLCRMPFKNRSVVV